MTTTPADPAREAVGDDLTERLKEAAQAYAALSPVDRALHDADHRRSFVRGQCGVDPGPDVLAEEVRRLREANASLSAELEEARNEGRRARTAELAWEKHCKEAEAECDALKAQLSAATARAEKAEARANSEGSDAAAARKRVRELDAALREIAKGETPPEQHGHYLAHRQCVKVARDVLKMKDTSDV